MTVKMTKTVVCDVCHQEIAMTGLEYHMEYKAYPIKDDNNYENRSTFRVMQADVCANCATKMAIVMIKVDRPYPWYEIVAINRETNEAI